MKKIEWNPTTFVKYFSLICEIKKLRPIINFIPYLAHAESRVYIYWIFFHITSATPFNPLILEFTKILVGIETLKWNYCSNFMFPSPEVSTLRWPGDALSLFRHAWFRGYRCLRCRLTDALASPTPLSLFMNLKRCFCVRTHR